MKAVVHDAYGPPEQVLTVHEIDAPTPRDDEVLVRVRAASMHPDLWHAVAGLPYIGRLVGGGLRTPAVRVPGTDVSGQVALIGRNVTTFRVGDEVFGEGVMQTLPGTDLAVGSGATFAEFAVAAPARLARKPRHVTFEQAATVATSGYVALCALGPRGRLEGRRVLINGAGGCVGSMAVQIAKADGAHVTGVDRAAKLAMLRTLGADVALDFTRVDVLQRDERYDFIVDVASTLSLAHCTRVLTPTGIYCQVGHGHYGKKGGKVLGCMLGGSLPRSLHLTWRLLTDRHFSTVNFRTFNKAQAMAALQAQLESGVLAPIVAKTFTLGEVPVAMRCLEDGQCPGRIVITP